MWAVYETISTGKVHWSVGARGGAGGTDLVLASDFYVRPHFRAFPDVYVLLDCPGGFCQGWAISGESPGSICGLCRPCPRPAGPRRRSPSVGGIWGISCPVCVLSQTAFTSQPFKPS